MRQCPWESPNLFPLSQNTRDPRSSLSSLFSIPRFTFAYARNVHDDGPGELIPSALRVSDFIRYRHSLPSSLPVIAGRPHLYFPSGVTRAPRPSATHRYCWGDHPIAQAPRNARFETASHKHPGADLCPPHCLSGPYRSTPVATPDGPLVGIPSLKRLCNARSPRESKQTLLRHHGNSTRSQLLEALLRRHPHGRGGKSGHGERSRPIIIRLQKVIATEAGAFVRLTLALLLFPPVI